MGPVVSISDYSLNPNQGCNGTGLVTVRMSQ
jgi:hypothetical protein